MITKIHRNECVMTEPNGFDDAGRSFCAGNSWSMLAWSSLPTSLRFCDVYTWSLKSPFSYKRFNVAIIVLVCPRLPAKFSVLSGSKAELERVDIVKTKIIIHACCVCVCVCVFPHNYGVANPERMKDPQCFLSQLSTNLVWYIHWVYVHAVLFSVCCYFNIFILLLFITFFFSVCVRVCVFELICLCVCVCVCVCRTFA